jgi:hypothetical protein
MSDGRTAESSGGLSARGVVALRVLRELGVLFETPHAPEPGPGAGWGGAQAPADHEFFRHVPLWSYEDPRYARPFAGEGAPVFETLPPATPLDEVVARTRLIVLLGAADSPTFRRCLEAPGVFVLIYEPDPVRLADFALRVPAPQLAKRAAILHGDPSGFAPPLGEVLPADLFQMGYPVFYALPGLDARLEADGHEACARFVTMLETLFFRHRVYHLSGQANLRGLPIRPLGRGLFYDQQLHAHANLFAFATRPDIRPLHRAFQGETALLVAAGPDLPGRMEQVRRLRERCVVIAVNNALKPMLAAGVRPHFVVANDTSVLTARSWEGLPRLDDVALVAHCLVDLGEAVLPRSYLFGTYEPELFGSRPSLRLHGSVITTAFSLARYMGCASCVLAGVQLCSPDPWTLGYARGSVHERYVEGEWPLTHAFPQLAPVENPFGLTRYTSLNFLDACLWLTEEIRVTGVPCVNLTRESIVYGAGIRHDEDPQVPDTGLLAKRLARLAAQRPPRPRVAAGLAAARRDLAMWGEVARGAEALVRREDEGFLAAALAVLDGFDKNGVSYLVQRFADYDNARMHAQVFDSRDPAERAAGLRYYLRRVRDMAKSFVAVLEEQQRRLLALPPA